MILEALHGIEGISRGLRPFMRKVFGKDYVLKAEEVGLPHQSPHLFVDQHDIELRFYYSIHVDIHRYVEAVVYVGAHEGEDQLEDLGGDVELDFAYVDPLEGGLQLHGLRVRQSQLLIEDADAERLQVHFVEQLHDELQH